MIVSASRRTDIPAFYTKWFMNRIRDGYFCTRNPFNASQVKSVSLLPKDVDAIVFWSKNPVPLLDRLDTLDALGYRYYIQYTLNDYPMAFEPGLPSANSRIDTFRRLAERLGDRKVVWRYDPIIISSITPVQYHLEQFEHLAQALKGYSRRVVISFADAYGKAEKRFKKLIESKGLKFYDLCAGENPDELRSLAAVLVKTAAGNGMEIYTCCEQADLQEQGIRPGSCIDAELIRSLFGTLQNTVKDKGQRAGCLCAASVDMGAYNCCSHFCCYCYANAGDDAVRRNMARHDPQNPFLLK